MAKRAGPYDPAPDPTQPDVIDGEFEDAAAATSAHAPPLGLDAALMDTCALC